MLYEHITYDQKRKQRKKQMQSMPASKKFSNLYFPRDVKKNVGSEGSKNVTEYCFTLILDISIYFVYKIYNHVKIYNKIKTKFLTAIKFKIF